MDQHKNISISGTHIMRATFLEHVVALLRFLPVAALLATLPATAWPATA